MYFIKKNGLLNLLVNQIWVYHMTKQKQEINVCSRKLNKRIVILRLLRAFLIKTIFYDRLSLICKIGSLSVFLLSILHFIFGWTLLIYNFIFLLYKSLIQNSDQKYVNRVKCSCSSNCGIRSPWFLKKTYWAMPC